MNDGLPLPSLAISVLRVLAFFLHPRPYELQRRPVVKRMIPVPYFGKIRVQCLAWNWGFQVDRRRGGPFGAASYRHSCRSDFPHAHGATCWPCARRSRNWRRRFRTYECQAEQMHQRENLKKKSWLGCTISMHSVDSRARFGYVFNVVKASLSVLAWENWARRPWPGVCKSLWVRCGARVWRRSRSRAQNCCNYYSHRAPTKLVLVLGPAAGGGSQRRSGGSTRHHHTAKAAYRQLSTTTTTEPYKRAVGHAHGGPETGDGGSEIVVVVVVLSMSTIIYIYSFLIGRHDEF